MVCCSAKQTVDIQKASLVGKQEKRSILDPCIHLPTISELPLNQFGPQYYCLMGRVVQSV
jgi:hypothetical protein